MTRRALKRCIAVLLPVIGLVFDYSSACAQRGRCASCLTFTPVIEVTSAAGQFRPSTVQSVLRTGDGRLFVSHLFGVAPDVAVYDAAGRFLQMAGRAGRGPGEFRNAPRLYPGPDNTVWAFEFQDSRLVRWDDQLRHLDTRKLDPPTGPSRALMLPNTTLVYDLRTGAAAAGFITLTVLDTAGTLTRKVELKSDTSAATIVAPAAAGEFWALQNNQLELRRYSSSGQLLRSVQLGVDYFQPWQGKAAGEGMEGFDFPPRPRHGELLDTGNDLVILLTRVAGAEWTATPSNRMFRPSELDYNGQYDTFVTLLDVRTGQTIASIRAPEHLQAVNGTRDLLYSTRQDDDGHVITRVVRLHARRP